jgi:hypothetical protein
MIGEKAAELIMRDVVPDRRNHVAMTSPVPSAPMPSSAVSPAALAVPPQSPMPASAAPSSDPPPQLAPQPGDETRGLATVQRLLERAAYFTVFSMPDPARPNIPIPHPQMPGAIIGVEVHEALHRLDVTARPPIGCGMQARKQIGEHIANVSIRWMVVPDDFQAAPGLEPPPTPLDPRCSQRFAMLDGQMTFLDRAGSGFRAFGTGHTFPTMVGSNPQLQIGAAIDILEGFSDFAGLPGTIAVNGYITPPHGLALVFILRFADRHGTLRLSGAPRTLRPIPDPDPNTVVVSLLGEIDPARPTTLNTDARGRMTGASVHELLRLVHVESQALPTARTVLHKGPIVGTLSGTLIFDPTGTSDIVPIQTRDGVFTFFGAHGCVTGTVAANVAEGRGFRTPLQGAPFPIFRFGGFGPILGGTGDFAGMTGLMSLNGAISVFPRTLSNMYVLRVNDVDGRFRAAAARSRQYARV